jgi:hypothetical protein
MDLTEHWGMRKRRLQIKLHLLLGIWPEECEMTSLDFRSYTLDLAFNYDLPFETLEMRRDLNI